MVRSGKDTQRRRKTFEEMASQDKERYQRELAENPPAAKKKKRKQNRACKKKKTKTKSGAQKIQAAMMMMTCSVQMESKEIK